MKLISLIRLILKHLVLLITVPLILAGIVIVLTKNSPLSFTSSTVLYTGLASGSSIEMEKSFSFYATNTAFDNLINIFKSRETQEEVAIRLLCQHLMLQQPDPKYISPKIYAEVKQEIPAYLYGYVSRNTNTQAGQAGQDSLSAEGPDTTDSFDLFPSQINRADYEKTVANITSLMQSSDTNFVSKLLNFDDPHYSIKAISTIKAERLSSSDLIKVTYEVDDPGICRQTLAIFNEVCIKNYKHIKENRSDAVVKYFEGQLRQAESKLKEAEDQLLAFNKSNNIINYYEQSKAVAVVKEDMEVDYNNKKAQLAGTEAATKKLEEKLDIQQLVQVNSNSLLEKRKLLGDLNFEIASVEADAGQGGNINKSKLTALKREAETLQNDIKKSVGDLYHYQNSVDGLPLNTTLNQWITNIIESENLKAKMRVMDQRNKDFQLQYAIYAPAGANIKRIEREISVSEQGYLEILHGLNLARLKLQDNELTSNLKTVDPPFYPLQPIATKRAVLVIAGGFVGFIFLLGIMITMEYLDDTLKNSKKASKVIGLPALGMIPKILLKPGLINLPLIQNRLLGITTQNLEHLLNTHHTGKTTKTVLFISTQRQEGKSVLAGNMAKKLTEEGKKVLLLNYAGKDLTIRKRRKFPFFTRILGYKDPRIDIDNIFLSDASKYLPHAQYFIYSLNEKVLETKDYTEILELNNIKISFIPEYVFIELPPLIYNSFPAGLVSAADMAILVCRANRLWSEADRAALDSLLSLSPGKVHFLVNGVELKEVEAVLGDLPKKTNEFRKKTKNFIRFQFFSKNQI